MRIIINPVYFDIVKNIGQIRYTIRQAAIVGWRVVSDQLNSVYNNKDGSQRSLGLVLFLSVMLTACSSAPVSENKVGTIKREADKQMQMGVVTQIKQVSIVGKSSYIAHSAGRTVGSIAGGAAGSGYGSVAGSIAGAFIGGILGSSADKGLQKKSGLEITVQLNNAEEVTVTQLAETSFKVGDLVRLEMAGGKAQVVHQREEH